MSDEPELEDVIFIMSCESTTLTLAESVLESGRLCSGRRELDTIIGKLENARALLDQIIGERALRHSGVTIPRG